MNAAYGGLYDADMVEFNIGHNKKTFKNIQLTKEFTVSFADVDNVVASDYVGLVLVMKKKEKSKSQAGK